MVRRIGNPFLALLLIFDPRVLLPGYRIPKLDHFFASDVRKSPMAPSRGHVIFKHSLVFSPASFALFRVALDVGVLEVSERAFGSNFCALLGRVFAVDDRSFCLKRGLAGVEDRKRRKLAESDSTNPAFDSPFPYETLGAGIGDAKRETFKLIIADEDLTVRGDSNCFDESLGDLGDVDAM